jgi:hypothetical protein
VSLQPALDRHQQVRRIPRLDNVEPGQDYSDCMRKGNQGVAQEFDPGHIRHPLVGHNHRDIVVFLD